MEEPKPAKTAGTLRAGKAVIKARRAKAGERSQVELGHDTLSRTIEWAALDSLSCGYRDILKNSLTKQNLTTIIS